MNEGNLIELKAPDGYVLVSLWSNHDTKSCGIKSPASVLRIFAVAGFTCDPRLEPDDFLPQFVCARFNQRFSGLLKGGARRLLVQAVDAGGGDWLKVIGQLADLGMMVPQKLQATDLCG